MRAFRFMCCRVHIRKLFTVGVLLSAMLAVLGCAARLPKDRTQISKSLEEKTGHGTGPAAKAGEVRIPEGVSLADGLSQDEAVAVALWNNAAFQADLATLGFARADLIEAGLLKNPVFSVLFPLGPKQMEFTLTAPLEALWQRPRRVAIAKLDAERVAEQLTQHGLNLVAEVKVACSELVLARERARLAQEGARVLGQILEIAEARLQAGDISELEASAARATARSAEEEATRLGREVSIAKDRLRSLLGLGTSQLEFELVPRPVTAWRTAEEVALLKTAFAARPDLRAAELSMEAAGKRVGWERSRVLALAGMLDINSRGREGFEAGPGVAGNLPIFDAGQGGVTRAQTEMDVAARRYVAVQQQIALEVRQARTRLVQATEAWKTWAERVLPAVEETQKGAAMAYAAGDVSYLFVLETTRELLQAQRRAAELDADLQRALAQLERATGKRWH